MYSNKWITLRINSIHFKKKLNVEEEYFNIKLKIINLESKIKLNENRKKIMPRNRYIFIYYKNFLPL